MLSMIIVGVLTAVAVIVLMFKINILRFLWVETLVDLLFTGALLMMFAGTLGGMIAAVIAGLVLSVALWIMKRRMGYERLRLKRWGLAWERVGPHEGKPG